MKKNFKRIFVLFLAVIQLTLLCGCDALDEMRRNQAFYGEGTDIIWNGATYKLLPPCEYLYPEMDYETTVWTTADDVPVLLSQMLAEQPLTPSTDGVILEQDYDTGYYCREDKYEQLIQRIQEGFDTEVVCYTYAVYDEEEWEYIEKTYTLTDEQVEVIELITATVEPDTMGEGWSLDYQWSVPLQECSEDMLLRRYGPEIAFTGRTYYLLLTIDTETLIFTVPEGCYAQFDEITKAYTEAWYDEWGTEEEFI